MPAAYLATAIRLCAGLSLLFVMLLLPPLAHAFDLEALGERLAQPAALQGRFEQRSWREEQQTQLHGDGRFLYQRDTRVIWQLLTPETMTLAFYEGMPAPGSRDDKAESVEAAFMLLDDRYAFARHLVAMMGGDWETLDDFYELRFEGDAEAWQVQLLPLAPPQENDYGRLTLEGGERLDRISLVSRIGDSLEVTLLEQRAVVDIGLQNFIQTWFSRQQPETETETIEVDLSEDDEGEDEDD
ncbi:outer membrane lipoprotein carrier protein LolA [Litchfieldella xinjiangensis]|uniref:outer membrane lipoprotein carrier protein LolA n=1 Tax=Litchfieldella xinjiangensis TaxID=1166948 RepID=UPI0006948182|nr:outer membrane lipoprotein carrier protein LolA [Halomonas xinjiangensis]